MFKLIKHVISNFYLALPMDRGHDGGDYEYEGYRKSSCSFPGKLSNNLIIPSGWQSYRQLDLFHWNPVR